MKRLFLLCLALAAMAVAAGLEGCTSAGSYYYRDGGYSTYDYQGNRLERHESGSYLNRGYDRY